MLSEQVIEQAKQVPITSYLQSIGITPTSKQTGKNDYSYCSPLSNEKTASFFVNETKNVFQDYSTGEKGDVVRLVRLIEKVNFPTAVKKLIAFTGAPLADTDTVQNPTTISDGFAETTITAIRKLQHPALLQYAEQVRRIPYPYLAEYVSQIHYTRKDNRTGKTRACFGIGFRTDAGSWAIRTDGYKGWIGQATITTLTVRGSKCINLFEGFFSFLSACVWFGKSKMHNTTIVLNSVSHLSRAIAILKEAETVFCYLDNDNAGRKAVQRLKDEGVNVIDRSNLYYAYNDFNEYLQTH